MDQPFNLTYRYRLKIAYDGSSFHGWQLQPGDTSIQEILKKSLQTCLRDSSIHPIASGRTDAGVHAAAQIVHFDTTLDSIDLNKTLRSLNGLLPVEIRVLAIESCPSTFHARYSAIGKIYHYHIQLGEVANPFYRKFRWHVHQHLNKELLTQACKKLEGSHDFKALANENHKGAAAHDSVRTLKRVEPHFNEDLLRLEFEGDGFLYKMVRNSVGLIVDVARGACSIEKIDSVFTSPDRSQAGFCAPAHGLIMHRVIYDPIWSPSKVLDL